MKNTLKIILFTLIFIIIWNYVFSILRIDKNNISDFYLEEDNSLDIIYIGGSNVEQYFNSMLAYHLYGFTTSLLSTSAQPFTATQSLIEETQKTQNPKLYIIDLARSQYDYPAESDDAWIREVVDEMPISVNKIKTINKVLKYGNISKNEYINYYFSFLKYHNKWKNITVDDFQHLWTLKGYAMWDKTVQTQKQERQKWNDEKTSLFKPNMKVLLELINYIKLNNLNTLFIVPIINSLSSTEQMRFNEAISILEQNNIKVINFNTNEQLYIDYATDFYESSHLNVYGSTKYTIYFAKYLKENYNFQDHRNDPRYYSWDEEYENFKYFFNYLTNEDFEKILSKYINNYY